MKREPTTRLSLLQRLGDLADQTSWRDFYETYDSLIHGMARRKGLDHQEAEDVVQEAVIAVARAMEAGRYRYDAEVTFKGYLRFIVCACIGKQWGRRHRELLANGATPDLADPRTADGDPVWEEEWVRHLPQVALKLLELSPKHHRIFELYAIQKEPAKKVARNVGVKVAQVYVVKHRLWPHYVEAMRRIEREGK